MFLSVRVPSMRREAKNTEVIDKNTGRKIPHVIWANTTTGRYRQYLKDENGNYVIKMKERTMSFRMNKKGELVPRYKKWQRKTEIISKIFTGEIEFRKICPPPAGVPDRAEVEVFNLNLEP